MGSSKDYLEYVLEQLSLLDDISYRAMMGEYIIYYRGKIIGGIYDDRFLMLLVDDVENREFLEKLLKAMYEELPAPKKRHK